VTAAAPPPPAVAAFLADVRRIHSLYGSSAKANLLVTQAIQAHGLAVAEAALAYVETENALLATEFLNNL
jgi:hypothetical protein